MSNVSFNADILAVLGITSIILFVGVLDIMPARIGLTAGQTTRSSMTITNEMFSIYNNPEFNFITRGNQKAR